MKPTRILSRFAGRRIVGRQFGASWWQMGFTLALIPAFISPKFQSSSRFSRSTIRPCQVCPGAVQPAIWSESLRRICFVNPPPVLRGRDRQLFRRRFSGQWFQTLRLMGNPANTVRARNAVSLAMRFKFLCSGCPILHKARSPVPNNFSGFRQQCGAVR